MKKCFKCNIEKPLDMFYKHKQMGDGHLNKCIDCTKEDVKSRYAVMVKSIDYVEKERARGRDKYYRLNYRLIKPSQESKRLSIQNYNKRYPEKVIVKAIMGRKVKVKIKGNHRHHWSYNKEHALDVIELTQKEHCTAHRFIIYDQERMMYRSLDGVLLDTREAHLEYIKSKF